MKYSKESEKCQSEREEQGKRGEPTERFWRAEATRGSDDEEEVILSMRAMSIAQINRLSGRTVTSMLSEEVSGSGK